MAFEQELMQFLQRKLSDQDIDKEKALIGSGLLDSLALMDLIMFIEERTGLKVPDDDVTPDNFETVARIGQLVERLKATA